MGGETYTDNSQQTAYYSWQTALKQRLTRGLLFGGNYTWGKSHVVYGRGHGAGFGGRLAKVGRLLLGDWQLSGIWRGRSGEPLGVSQTGGRPDLIDIKGAVNKQC